MLHRFKYFDLSIMDDSDNKYILYLAADADARPIELNNQPPQQKGRIMIETFDIQLHNHVIFNNPSFS